MNNLPRQLALVPLLLVSFSSVLALVPSTPTNNGHRLPSVPEHDSGVVVSRQGFFLKTAAAAGVTFLGTAITMTTTPAPVNAFENKISTQYDDRPKRKGPPPKDLGVGIRTDLLGGVEEYRGIGIGTLPELADTNAFLQGITINVADGDQQKMMINFLVKSFDMEILRQTVQDSVEETWLGYGPEQLSIPDNFEIPVSSFNKYGGHASINVRYDTQSIAPFYRQGDDPPGNNIAYLQLGVPGYRISQMIEYKGKIIDAYGLVNVVSPSGLPIRGIVGISPDPIMFVAINCRDVQESKVFYENLGFVEQDVPYSRPSKGTTMFEPAPPKGSCYMSPSGNTTTGMGILLLSGGKKNKSVIANPAVGSLNIVYNPSSSPSSSEMTEEGKNLTLKDPSGVSVKFISDGTFSATEKRTR